MSDPYLVKRIGISENMSNKYLLEVNGTCPLCGKLLLDTKGKRTTKKFEIAHIYPNSPLDSEVKELKGLERLGINCEEFDNKIALCKDCHGYYDDHKTKEEYLNLLKIKKKLMKAFNAKQSASYQDLEEEILLVINALSKLDMSTVQKMRLELKALKIEDKIEDEYFMLKLKVREYVCTYFNLILDTFKTLEKTNQINFNIIASEVKTTFLKCEQETKDKSEIFKSLVNWISSKTAETSIESCEVIISFFIQNCEVFHEIT